MHSAFVRFLLIVVTVVANIGCTQDTALILELLVDPSSVTIGMDQTQPFTATTEYVEGNRADVTEQLTWTSSDEEVATIDDTRLAPEVEGVGSRDCDIAAWVGDLECSSTRVSVICDRSETINITANNGEGRVDSSLQLTAACLIGGDGIDLTDIVEWSTSDEEFATVDSEGVAMGLTEIAATMDGVTSSRPQGTRNPNRSAARNLSRLELDTGRWSPIESSKSGSFMTTMDFDTIHS